jgi:hypothetical protein
MVAEGGGDGENFWAEWGGGGLEVWRRRRRDSGVGMDRGKALVPLCVDKKESDSLLTRSGRIGALLCI